MDKAFISKKTIIYKDNENTDVGKLMDKRSRKPKMQSRMDNPEKLSTLGIQDTGQKNKIK